MKAPIDWNEVIPMLHAEGITISGLICVRRALMKNGSRETFIQWINTEPALQKILLEAIAQMEPTTGRLIEVVS